ncbi:MAG: transcriptional regulator [Candidatus Bathyarchaeales archaeon]
MNRAEMTDITESALRKAGFEVSKRCCSRPSCFDMVARRKFQLAFVKTHENIGNVSVRDALELKMLSKHLSAVPLLIGEKTHHKPMEDDTIYSRYGIYAITTMTLEDIILHGRNPLVDATPGGYYVRLDGEKIRKKRQSLELSVGKLAEMTGISRRTLYGYERGKVKASISAAYNLEYALGVPLVQEIDVFQPPLEQDTGFLSKAKLLLSTHHCLHVVERKLSRLNVFVAHVKRAPFDFIAKSRKEDVNIVGGVASRKEPNLEKRVEEIISVSKVIDAQPVLITEKENAKNDNIKCIDRKELEKIDNLRQLRELL